jgi:hypothetical protein
MRARRFLLITAVVATLALSLAHVANASCGRPPPLPRAIDRAEVVFVGTVAAVENLHRTATFKVESVWKGTVDETVVVHGGPKASLKGERVWTSIDRAYEPATRYLVVPSGRSGAILLDNACTNTQPYTADLADLRPPQAHPPLAGGAPPVAPTSQDASADLPLWALVVLVAAGTGVLATAAAWLRARTRALP